MVNRVVPGKKLYRLIVLSPLIALIVVCYSIVEITWINGTTPPAPLPSSSSLTLSSADRLGRTVVDDDDTADSIIRLRVPSDPSEVASVWRQLFNASDSHSPLKTCTPTCQLEVRRISPDSDRPRHNQEQPHHSSWLLQSLDEHGRRKDVGGDEYYVAFYDNQFLRPTDSSNFSNGNHDQQYYGMATHVANMEDLGNGQYSLIFSTTPLHPNPVNLSGRGELVIHLQFTCGIGTLPQPLKQSWTVGGSSGIRFTVPNVTIPHFQYYRKPALLWDWSQHDKVISFGDSIMQQLVRKQSGRPTFHPKMIASRNIARPLNTHTLPSIQKLLEEWYGDTLRHAGVGLVLGSAVWDLCNPTKSNHSDFADHIVALGGFLRHVQETYPLVTVYWKLPYAIHPHAVNASKCMTIRRCIFMTRYMSTSRSKQLYELQKRLVQEMNVRYLDVWMASYLSADWMKTNDGRHYRWEFNHYIIQQYWGVLGREGI